MSRCVIDVKECLTRMNGVFSRGDELISFDAQRESLKLLEMSLDLKEGMSAVIDYLATKRFSYATRWGLLEILNNLHTELNMVGNSAPIESVHLERSTLRVHVLCFDEILTPTEWLEEIENEGRSISRDTKGIVRELQESGIFSWQRKR